jgi:hypothetical protein
MGRGPVSVAADTGLESISARAPTSGDAYSRTTHTSAGPCGMSCAWTGWAKSHFFIVC